MSSTHALQAALESESFKSAMSFFRGPEGIILGAGKTVGNSIEGWAPGALFIDTNASAGQQHWVNEGSKTTASWSRIEAGDISLLASEKIALAALAYIELAGTAYIGLDDNAYIDFGTGDDVRMEWNGSVLQLAPPTGFWADCPLIGYANGHTLAYEFFDDFMSFDVGDNTGRWNLNQTNGTAILGSSETSNTPGLGGYVSIGTGGTAQYDYATIKPCTTDTGAPFKITKDSGKSLWYESRIMVSSIADVNIMVGLFNENADDMSVDATGAEAVQDGVYFRSLVATETEIDTAVNKDTTETEVKSNGGTLAANTAIVLGFKFDGVSTISFYINGTVLTDTVEADATNFPSDQGLVPGFFIKDAQSGGAAKRMFVDWVKCVQLR